jgi:isoleucyl-tRNA synthetase
LAVNEKEEYVKVKDAKGENTYILMKARLEEIFKKGEKYTIISTFKGKDLEGKTYTPLFDYFSDRKNAFKVVCGDFVTNSRFYIIII